MISKKALIVILLLPILFIVSYELTSAYINGDQGKHMGYRDLYSALGGSSFEEVSGVAYKHVNSREPISYYILWLGAISGINKDIFISFLNLVLLAGLILAGLKYKASRLVIFLLLTNYYVFAMMGSAERLKIAYILLVYATLFTGKKSFFLLIVSPFAHLQSAILFPSLLLGVYSKNIRYQLIKLLKGKIAINKNYFATSVVATIFIFLILSIQFDAIVNKALSYISYDFLLNSVYKLLVLSLILLIATKDRFRMILVILPLIPATLLLGDERLNMIAFTLGIYFLMIERRLSHPLILMLLLYFSIKGIDFLYRVFVHGSGY